MDSQLPSGRWHLTNLNPPSYQNELLKRIGTLDNSDRFGWSVAALGDLDGDGVGDLAVGAIGDDDGGSDHGAVWVLFLDGVAACPWDLNGDGEVGPFDLALVLGFWGPNPGHPSDLNGDGEVGPFDLALLLGNCGLCP